MHHARTSAPSTTGEAPSTHRPVASADTPSSRSVAFHPASGDSPSSSSTATVDVPPDGSAVGPLASPAASAGSRRRIGIIAILLSVTGMGAAGLFGRFATPPGAVTGEALTLGRMLVGAMGMLALLMISGRLGQLRRIRMSWSVALGGVFLGISLATYLSATVLTDMSRAVVLHYLGPVLATLLARLLLKETVSRVEVLSLGTSFGGMMLAADLLGGSTEASSQQDAVGTVLGVVSGITYGVALLCYRYRSDMPADVRSFWNFTFGAVATAGMVALVRPDLSGMTAGHWAWAGGLFVVSGLIALGLLVVAGKYLRAAELSGLSYLEIVVATALGAMVFAEAVTPTMLIGMALIIVAAVVPLMRRRTLANTAMSLESGA